MSRRALHRRARRARPRVRARDAARHRRGGPGVRGNDESRSGDGRWRGAGVPRRRAHRRHGVRPVSSDRARRRRRAEISALGGAPRRGRAARGCQRRAVHAPLSSRRRSRAARHRLAQHRARVPADRRSDFPEPPPSRRRRSASTVSDDRRDVPEGGVRSRARPSSGRTGRALHDGRRRNRSRRPHVGARPVRRGRGGVHARARRESPREQFAARRPGVRCARRPRDGRPAS